MEYYLNVQTMSNEMILIQDLIHEIRGKKVMLDFDLARLYQVETRVNSSRSQFVTLDNPGRGSNVKYKPFVFTEQGVAMLSSVSLKLEELKAKVDLLKQEQEDNLEAMNDLSEDVRHDIDNLYMAIGELSARIEEKKNEPRPRIGFK